jgi:Flp pilus assembly protein TadD
VRHWRVIDDGHMGARSDMAQVLQRRYASGQDAEALLKQAADDGQIGALNDLAILLEERGEAKKAVALYRRAIEADDVHALHNLASLHEDRGEVEQAEQLYRKALDVNANDSRALTNLAALLDTDEWLPGAETVSLLRRAFDLDPSDRVALNNLVNVWAEVADEDEVGEVYRQAGEAGNVDALFELAARLDERGDVENAEVLYRRAASAGHLEPG